MEKKSLSLSEKRKKLAEQKKTKKVKKQNLKANDPPQARLSNLLEHYQSGRFGDAEKLAVPITQEFPQHVFAWKVLGAVLGKMGRKSEAAEADQTAVALSPQDADAHYNLGVTLQELGRFDEAEVSYRQAIVLQPDLAEAHNNLGNTLKELGRLEEACLACIQAINLNSDFTDAYVNLSLAIKNVRFSSSDRELYPPLTQMLTAGNYTRPNDVARSILSLLKHDPLIKELLLEKNFAASLKEANSIIVNLDKLALLHHLMRVCPLPDLQFEAFFVTMRRLLLTNLEKIEGSSELIYFLSTLSLHCFTNEYVYIESNEEIRLVEELQNMVAQTVMRSERPEAIKILCLASYRPLHQYDWCQKLEALDHLEEVKERLIEQPLAEMTVKKDISILAGISNEISLEVREQYEENPYPRWVKLAIPTKAQSVSKICDDVKLKLHSENIKEISAPKILVAGCGTGQHSIVTATRFSDCQVLAVDLSLASLAYAQRKTKELDVRNLDYLQADILDLGQLNREFDIIESVGVLHHMDNPMAGWRVIADLLRPGGLMKIGLYSELARGPIIKAREEIASLSVGTTETEIRNFRQSLKESRDLDHQRLTTFLDFFSLSMLRDLIFHVQEHRFAIPQIQVCLGELGLKFCGFENKGAIDSMFTEFHGQGSDIYDLALWHKFEESNPSTFIGMYQFWCQKF